MGKEELKFLLADLYIVLMNLGVGSLNFNDLSDLEISTMKESVEFLNNKRIAAESEIIKIIQEIELNARYGEEYEE